MKGNFLSVFCFSFLILCSQCVQAQQYRLTLYDTHDLLELSDKFEDVVANIELPDSVVLKVDLSNMIAFITKAYAAICVEFLNDPTNVELGNKIDAYNNLFVVLENDLAMFLESCQDRDPDLRVAQNIIHALQNLHGLDPSSETSYTKKVKAFFEKLPSSVKIAGAVVVASAVVLGLYKVSTGLKNRSKKIEEEAANKDATVVPNKPAKKVERKQEETVQNTPQDKPAQRERQQTLPVITEEPLSQEQVAPEQSRTEAIRQSFLRACVCGGNSRTDD
jgi:hypothetical protein